MLYKFSMTEFSPDHTESFSCHRIRSYPSLKFMCPATKRAPLAAVEQWLSQLIRFQHIFAPTPVVPGLLDFFCASKYGLVFRPWDNCWDNCWSSLGSDFQWRSFLYWFVHQPSQKKKRHLQNLAGSENSGYSMTSIFVWRISRSQTRPCNVAANLPDRYPNYVSYPMIFPVVQSCPIYPHSFGLIPMNHNKSPR